MKRNLLLGGVLALLLGVTWLVTEKKAFEHLPPAEAALQEALQSPQRYQLPNVTLTQQGQVWVNSEGEMVRAERLQEFHHSLEQFHVSKTIPSEEGGLEAAAYFGQGLTFTVGKRQFVLGDIAPTGESFYFKVEGLPGVHLVDLNQMGSALVSDENRILQQEKYHRLRDLLQLPSARWRENRLVMLGQFGEFRQWSAGKFVLNAEEVSSHPWGHVLLEALQAGLSSLEVAGKTLDHPPTKRAGLDDWVFVLGDKSELRWEFYQHPDLELVYVWIPKQQKAYPLSQDSSDFLRELLPRLINRPLPLTIHPVPLDRVKLTEAGQAWVGVRKGQGMEFTPEGINAKRASELVKFFYTPQSFDYVTLLAADECARLKQGARFQVDWENEHWGVLPIQGGLVFLQCEAHVALTWSLPLDSSLDFATLRLK